MHDADDDQPHFVEYGTPVEQVGENESLSKLAEENQRKAQKVTDKQGRVRFHGAFTGGYSAGYYNTVGTEEGWAPSTFQSSRQKKDEKFGQRPEDFMDDEDLGEFGIAPRSVKTRDKYSQNEVQTSRAAWDPVHPGFTSALQDVFKPVKMTKAVRILRLMGWKEGQGVGPRLKRKVKKKYGPTLPSDNEEQAGSDDSDFSVSGEITFAPRDITQINFNSKDNLYGIGYEPLRADNSRSQTQTYGEQEEERLMFGGKRGMSGQAFAGADNSDDEGDIYSKESLSNYDKILGGENIDKFSEHHHIKSENRSSHETLFKTTTQILENFHLSTKTSSTQKQYTLPKLPPGYRASRVTMTTNKQPKILGKMDSNLRRIMLGDSKTDVGLLPADKVPDEPGLLPNKPTQSTSLEITNRFSAASESLPTDNMNAEQSVDLELPPPPMRSDQPLNQSSVEFKPFNKNPEKQTRYEKYLEVKRLGRKDPYSLICPAHYSKFERDREREEFERSGSFFKNLSGVMASRFTRGKVSEEDHDKTVSVRVDEQFVDQIDDKKNAVEMKMFGDLTRESYEWHPHRVLCRRFNVPDPYPNSQLVGLPVVTKDKLSAYNFLDIESLTQTPEQREKEKGSRLFSESDKKEDKESLIKSHMNKQTTPTTLEDRPPIDLFSAVFQDSSDDSSSSEEEEQTVVTERIIKTDNTDTVTADKLSADKSISAQSQTDNQTKEKTLSNKTKISIESSYHKPREVASLYDAPAADKPASESLDDFKPRFVSKKQRERENQKSKQATKKSRWNALDVDDVLEERETLDIKPPSVTSHNTDISKSSIVDNTQPQTNTAQTAVQQDTTISSPLLTYDPRADNSNSHVTETEKDPKAKALAVLATLNSQINNTNSQSNNTQPDSDIIPSVEAGEVQSYLENKESSDDEMAWMPALPPDLPPDLPEGTDREEHRKHKKHKSKEKHKKKSKKSHKSHHH